MVSIVIAAAASIIAGRALAGSNASNANTLLRLIYHNNLNSTDDTNHIGAILLSPMTYPDGETACRALCENLLSVTDLSSHLDDFRAELSYLAYAGFESADQAYFVGNNRVVTVHKGIGALREASADDPPYRGARLPALCTQSVQNNEATNSTAVPGSEVTVQAAGNYYTGYRNKKSWRFLGIQYGQYPQRWTYSTLYNATNASFNATVYGSECLQYGSGNYGIGDQITALRWTINNIANFGGDPNMITINGESAGAGSVRTLLGSPKAIGMFQGAVAMSNLGGGVDLGDSRNYGTTYSSYYTVNQSFTLAGEQIFRQAGCNQTTLAAQVACLRTYPGDLTSFSDVARYVVQDGTIVNTPELEVGYYNDNVAHVNVIWGNTMNDGASFSAYSRACATEATCLEANLYIGAYYANAIIASGLFPYYDTGNLTADSFNVSQRIITDNTFRCVDQATAFAGFATSNFPSAYYYQMDRTYSGYNPNNVDDTGPVEPGYPLGDPNLPYYRVHGSDMAWVFGNLFSFRDANDLYSIQLTTDYFGIFFRTGNPNPPWAFLEVLEHTSTLRAIEETGPWPPVYTDTGPIKQLDYPSLTTTFVDLEQCAWLNYSIA